MDFRERLYRSYASQQVGVTAEKLDVVLARSAPYFRRILKWLPVQKTDRIVDLGCGYGSLLYFLQKNGYSNLGGVDVSPEQVELAHHLGLNYVVGGEIRDFLLSAAPGSVASVIAFDVFEHLTRSELLEMGDSITRVLTAEGRLIAHVPNAAGLFSGVIRYGDLTHENAFTPLNLLQFGNACGLKLIAIQEDTPVIHGVVSFARWLIWKLGSAPLRLLFLAESPVAFSNVVLSQNMLAVFAKV